MAKKRVSDIMNHRLVPKHEILREKERDEIVARYGGDIDMFPLIRTSDPVCKQLGGKSGDLVRITRASRTRGKACYYRLVVEG